jgi:hypothetical protein
MRLRSRQSPSTRAVDSHHHHDEATSDWRSPDIEIGSQPHHKNGDVALAFGRDGGALPLLVKDGSGQPVSVSTFLGKVLK